MNKETKNTLALIIIGLLIMLMPSCKVMNIEGAHKVTNVRKTNTGFIIKLEGLKKEFTPYFGDTLKKGDYITLKRRKLNYRKL